MRLAVRYRTPGAGAVAGGTIVTYGAMSGEPCTVSPASLIVPRHQPARLLVGAMVQTASPQTRAALFGNWSSDRNGQAARADSGDLRHRPDPQAVAAASMGERSGKIVLLPNGE